MENHYRCVQDYKVVHPYGSVYTFKKDSVIRESVLLRFGIRLPSDIFVLIA